MPRTKRSLVLRLLPALAGLALAVLCARLGFWQLDRAALKGSLAQRYALAQVAPAEQLPAIGEAKAVEGRRVRASGRWLADQTVWIDNRTHDGRAGVHVVTPLQLVDGSLLYVNRGWAPLDARRTALPAPPLTGGSVSVEGVAVMPAERVFSLGSGGGGGRLWPALDAGHLAAAAKGRVLYPLVLQQTGPEPDGLVRAWAEPGLGAERSRGYALQWFVFSLMALGASLWLGARGLRHHAS